MRSAGKVLLTAINVMSSVRRPERRAAASIRSITRGRFSAIDMKSINHKGHKGPQRKSCVFYFAYLRVLCGLKGIYMIAVGGAGSSGLPALANGTLIMTATSTASAIKAAMNGGASITAGM